MGEKLTFFFTRWENGRTEKIMAATVRAFAQIFSDQKICVVHHVHAKKMININSDTLKDEAVNLPPAVKNSDAVFLIYASISDIEGELSFDNQMNRFLSGISKHILVNLMHDDHAQHFQVYIDAIQEENSAVKIIYIDSYIGCELILDALNTEHRTNAIFDSHEHDCYSEIISKNLLLCNQYVNSIATISIANPKKPPTKYCYFDFNENIVKIIKNSEGRVHFMHQWLLQLNNPLDYYYTYATDDNHTKEIIERMSGFFKRKLPFSIPHIDAEKSNGFADVEKYVDELINGKMVIALIDGFYLNKPYPMFEVISILEKNGLFQQNGCDILINYDKVDKISKQNRFFPILFGKQAHSILDVNGQNAVIEYWSKFSDEKYPIDKIKKIQQLVKPTLQVISRLNYQPFKKYTETAESLLRNHEEICNSIFCNVVKSLDLAIYRHISESENINHRRS